MNIKNIKTYILSGILALSMSSCLDKYPEDSIPLFGQSDNPARSAGRLCVLREGLL